MYRVTRPMRHLVESNVSSFYALGTRTVRTCNAITHKHYNNAQRMHRHAYFRKSTYTKGLVLSSPFAFPIWVCSSRTAGSCGHNSTGKEYSR